MLASFYSLFLLPLSFFFYLFSFSLGTLSNTSRAGLIFIFLFFTGFIYTYNADFFDLFLFWEFLLHIPCWLRFYPGNFSYTSRTGFIFYLGSFSYTSHACFIFLWGVSLTHPMLASFLSRVGFSYTSHTRFFLSGEFLLHIPCLLFVWGVSLTHPMLAFFLSFFL